MDKELKKTKPGDVYHTLHVPDDYIMWEYKKAWPKTDMKKRGVEFICAWVYQQNIASKPSEEKFTVNEPWRLPCGVEIKKGYMKTLAAKKSAGMEVRTDSVSEFNDAMNDISEATENTFWEVKNLVVYNKIAAATITFQIFNPDTRGSGLYLHHITQGKVEQSYVDVLLFDQMRYCDQFYEKIAHCMHGQSTLTVDTRACALKNKIKSNQIKTRKKNVAPTVPVSDLKKLLDHYENERV